MSGSSAAAVFASTRWPILAMSEARSMTSGALLFTALLSSRLASLSPLSAFSDSFSSYSSRSLTSLFTSFPPMSLIASVSTGNEVSTGDDLCHVRGLLHRRGESLKLLPLLSLLIPLVLLFGTLDEIVLVGNECQLARAEVNLAYPISIPYVAVVVEAAVSPLQGHDANRY
jgi:hypothetical protein